MNMNITCEQYFDRFCRTCMYEICETTFAVEQSEPQWHSILGGAEGCGGNLSIAELLSSTIPQIKVTHSDELPKKICHACLQQLMSVYHFQQMCIQSDQQVRQMIAKRYIHLNEPVSDALAEDQIYKKIYIIREIRAEGTERRNDVGKISVSNPLPNCGEPLHSVGEVIENCTDPQVDISNYVQNEPIHDDEYLTNDNHKDILNSTISVKDEIVSVAMKSPLAHVCALCNKSFKQLRLLKYHLKRHKKWEEKKNEMPLPKPKTNFEHYRFQCDICNRFFHKPESLNKHRLAHENNVDTKTHSCDLCEKRFSSRRTLWVHKKNSHIVNDSQQTYKQYLCLTCKKTFKNSVMLRKHQRTHTGERPFLCAECGKAFSSNSSLRYHLVRHSEVKPFECPDCPKRFYCRGDLVKHRAVHGGIKRHICDICGASFLESCYLKLHKKYHRGEKNHKCDYCEMSFVTSDAKRCHMRTHTGEKPYKCKYCERAFARTYDRVKHLRTHLGENVYGCKLCPSAYRLASELRVHFATHKNDDEETRERNFSALKDKETKLRLQFAGKGTQKLLEGAESQK